MAELPVSGRTVGLALAAGRGVFAWWPASSASPDTARTEEFGFDADALAAGDDSTLLPCLRAARLAVTRHAPSHDARAQIGLHVALASPWTSPREVALPPMREAEARRVLARDAARYFPVRRAEPAVAVRALRRGAWLAADADDVVLDAIARAAHAAGFSALRIVPAVAAWAHAVGDAQGGTVVLDGEAAVLGVRHGRLDSLRRCRAADLPAGAAASGDALALAARHAPQCDEREFLSTAQRAVRDASVTRMARQLMAIGVAAIIVIGVLQAWGGAYQVARLQRQRAVLQPTVAPLVALRDSLLAVHEARTALVLGRAQARWSERLSALAETLPDGAYFTAFRGAGDSVVVEGTASDAQTAVARLKSGRGVRLVRPTAAAASTDDDREPFSAVVFFGAGGTR
jgi:Tfp pilus assembly protein PilN